MNKLVPKNLGAWRKWLAQHHDTETEIWLVYYRKATGKPSIDYEGSVEEALCFGWVDSLIRNIDNERYARKFTPRKATSRWSELNKERARKMISQRKMTAAGTAAIAAAKATGLWNQSARPDISHEMPAEFEQSLKKNKKAMAYFHKLAPGYQKQYVAWIAIARRPETRAKRIRESIALLEKSQKLGMK